MLPIVGQIFTAVRPDMPRAPFARCGAVGVIPGGFMIWALHTEICRWLSVLASRVAALASWL